MLKAALSRLHQEFSPAVLTIGQKYYVGGHVLSIKLSDGLLRGRVKGNSGQIYSVHLDLKTWPHTGSLCGCPDRVKCKHAAACFFALQAREHLTIIEPLVVSQQITASGKQVIPAQDEVINADSFTWYSEYAPESNDFFSYQLGILVNNKPINIVPLVVNLLRQMDINTLDHLPDAKLMHLPIEQHKWLQIELGRIKPLLRLLLQYGLNESNKVAMLELRRYQLALMQEAEQAVRAVSARWRGTDDIRLCLKQLSAIEALPMVTPPKSLKTQLRDYQQHGLNWLQFLKQHDFAGILADDMGLGKTVQTLAHLLYEKERGFLSHASLIIAPTSLVGNWYTEAKRFTPDLKVLIFHGFDRHQGQFDDYDLVISTYGLIQRDKIRFLAYPFYYLILDEAQFIKNHRTKTTQIVQQLKSKHRLCLTGTPLENHLGELWSLYHFLMPGLLGDAKQFRQYFRIPIEKEHDLERRAVLNGRIQPFMLRRSKNEVLRELPPKTEMIRLVELIGPQRDLYEAIRLTMEKKVREAIAVQGMGRSHIVLLDALLKLRQVCCDPRLVSLADAAMAHGHSAKLDLLIELLDNLMEEGRRVLVFSQFTSMLKLIEDVLITKGYSYLKLTGQTKNRQALVEEFQTGSVPIFLINLKAGGTGLNLTRADTVILYDPWWNPAVQDQAASRSHRIGQEEPVFIYKLITAGTVEEVILDIQARKKQLFEGVLMNQPMQLTGLSDVDIDRFFAPLS